MTDAPQATATTIVAATPPPSRWSPLTQTFVGVFGALVAAAGLLVTIGGWKGELDSRVVTLERDMVEVRANQKTYIPILVGMQSDMKYLADRARREDERHDRASGGQP